MRQAGSRQFADIVIGVSPGAAVGQGHAAADAVEAAVERALPNADVVVHVEPLEDATLRERAHAAALAVPRVREVHNLALVDVGRQDGAVAAREAAGRLSRSTRRTTIAEQLETRDLRRGARDRRRADAPRAARRSDGRRARSRPKARRSCAAIVREATGREPRELRFLNTTHGLVAFLTLGLEGTHRLDEAHQRASEIEERIRRERPDIADVIVHTEP